MAAFLVLQEDQSLVEYRSWKTTYSLQKSTLATTLKVFLTIMEDLLEVGYDSAYWNPSESRAGWEYGTGLCGLFSDEEWDLRWWMP